MMARHKTHLYVTGGEMNYRKWNRVLTAGIVLGWLGVNAGLVMLHRMYNG